MVNEFAYSTSVAEEMILTAYNELLQNLDFEVKDIIIKNKIKSIIKRELETEIIKFGYILDFDHMNYRLITDCDIKYSKVRFAGIDSVPEHIFIEKMSQLIIERFDSSTIRFISNFLTSDDLVMKCSSTELLYRGIFGTILVESMLSLYGKYKEITFSNDQTRLSTTLLFNMWWNKIVNPHPLKCVITDELNNKIEHNLYLRSCLWIMCNGCVAFSQCRLAKVEC